jgi:hypothetical protein
MPRVPAFYSVNEAKKAAAHRVYHNNGACLRERPRHQSGASEAA